MATFYIDPDVTAGGAGTELDPFKLWSEVTWTAGNTYYQKRGTTSTAQVTIGTTGTSGNVITIGAYGTGAKPIIDLGGVADYGILGNGKEYIEISDLVIKNPVKTGIVLWQSNAYPGADCVVSDCEFYDCGDFGVALNDQAGLTQPKIRTGCIIQDCYAIRCGQAGMSIGGGQTGCIIRRCEAVETCLTGNSWGIYMRPRAQNQRSTDDWTNIGGNVWELDLVASGTMDYEAILRVTVTGRETTGNPALTAGVYGSIGPNEWGQDLSVGVHNKLQIDIQEDPTQGATGRSINVISAEATDCLIENCIATDTEDASGVYDGVGIGCDISCTNSVMRYNRVSGSKGGGISANVARGTSIYGNIVTGNDAGIHAPTFLNLAGYTNRIFNNVIDSNTTSGLWMTRVDQLDIYNNIITNNGIGLNNVFELTYEDNTYNEDYNILYGNTTDLVAESATLGSNDITSDPLIDSDYKPTVNSPALLAGRDIKALTKDFDNKCFGHPPAIGAYRGF